MEMSLALGGGGIKGIAHIGVIDCLEKAGYKIRAIAGTSAGGLTGAIYAAGYSPAEILAILESIDPQRLYARNTGDGPSLIGYSGLAEALTAVLGECLFSDLAIPFACTAVDIGTAQEVYLNAGRVMDAVLATIAIPGVFPPKRMGEAELVDGSILDPVPVNLARNMNPGLPVVAVALNPAQAEWAHNPQFNSLPTMPLPIPPPIIEGFARMRIGQAMRIFLQSMDISARMLTELRLAADKPDVIIRPNVHQYGMLDTANPHDLFRAGFEAAEKALPQIQQALEWPNTIRRKLRQVVESQNHDAKSSVKINLPRLPIRPTGGSR